MPFPPMDLGRVIVITRRVTTIPIQLTECIWRVIVITRRVIVISIQVTECIRWVIVIPIPSPAYNESSIARNGSSATRQQPIPNRQRFSSSRQKADHDDGKTGFAVGWPRGRGQQRPGRAGFGIRV